MPGRTKRSTFSSASNGNGGFCPSLSKKAAAWEGKKPHTQLRREKDIVGKRKRHTVGKGEKAHSWEGEKGVQLGRRKRHSFVKKEKAHKPTVWVQFEVD